MLLAFSFVDQLLYAMALSDNPVISYSVLVQQIYFNRAPSRQPRLISNNVSLQGPFHNDTDIPIMRLLTVNASVIGLDKGLLDLAILHQQSIPLAAVVAEDGGAVKAQVQGLGELAGWITQEADLFNRKNHVNHKYKTPRDGL